MEFSSGSASPEPGRSALAPMVRKLELWKRLNGEEQAAVLSLPFEMGEMTPCQYLVRYGQEASHSSLLISGFAIRQKLTRDGGRSINAVHMPGDMVDLQNSLLGLADHNVQALTKATFAKISNEAIIDLALRFPNIGLAMWYDTLVDGSIFREWILNISRRPAETRVAHLLCEFGIRLESLGLGDRASFELPMTQEQLADATGMTSVHVNRTFRALEERGTITRTVRYITVANWAELKKAGEFDEIYLHLGGGRIC